MTKHKSVALPLLPLLDHKGFRAYTTMRGINPRQSDDPYAGFNVCHYSGDSQAHIAECRAILATKFSTDEHHLIIPRQTHSCSILTITDTLPSETELEGVDGIVTTRRDIIIGVNTADCVPLIMVDTEAGVSAAVHAGWRGAVAGIASEALKSMKKAGADPRNIIAVMGPSICLKCFEVGPEVAVQFDPGSVVTAGYTRPHVSLHNHLTDELLSLGLSESNILPFEEKMCTRCHPTDFFSARASGVASGRVFTFITALPS